MAVFLTVVFMSLVAFFIHLSVTKQPKTFAKVVELFLLYQLVFNVGLTSLLGFIGQAFMPEMVASFLGWQPSPFEEELANVNLAFAVLGILCIWIRGHFWTATIIGISIWLISDGIGHIADMVINHNYAPGNIGVPLYTDIIVPIVLLISLGLYLSLNKAKRPLQAKFTD